jgi:hypothetical protein
MMSLPWTVGDLKAQGEAPQPATPTTAATPEHEELAALIEKVRAAHWAHPRANGIDRYKAMLRFTPTRADQSSAEFDLAVTFLAPNLLKYRVDEPGETLKQGHDESGAWSLVGTKVIKLEGKDYREAAATVRQRLALASQLLRLLDPAAVLAQLRAATPPAPTQFPVARDKRIEALAVEGRFEDFPLQFPTEDGRTSASVQLKVVVDKASSRLLMIESRVLDADGKPKGRRERVYLRDLTEQDGVVLPREVLLYDDHTLHARIAIRAIDLDPERITTADVRRAK